MATEYIVSEPNQEKWFQNITFVSHSRELKDWVRGSRMFRVNEAYGNAAALRSYCGVSENVPIWGEIQHSLWVNDQIKAKERRSKLLPTLFTWNELLRIQASVPIGDPMLYYAKVAEKFKANKGNQAIGLPKFRRIETLESRIKSYQNFLRFSLHFVHDYEFVLVLHPDEFKYQEKVRGKKFRDVKIYCPPSSGNPMEDYFTLLAKSKLVLSDYLGAHIFRSTYLFNSKVHLTTDLWRNPIEKSGITELFDAYIDDTSKENRKEVSKHLLGVNHFKSVNELKEILGFTNSKKLLGSAIKTFYDLRNSV